MQNLDFGLLEMLFYCWETNMVRFCCVWAGERIRTTLETLFSWSSFREILWRALSGLNTKWWFSLYFCLNFMHFSKIHQLQRSVTSRLLVCLQSSWYLLHLARAEKLKNGIYDARGYDLPPLPRANVKRNFGKSRLAHQVDVHHPTLWFSADLKRRSSKWICLI